MKKHDALAPRLRHRITIEQADLTPQEGGNYAVAWQEVATLWAEVLPVESHARGTETLLHGQMVATLTHEITLRYVEGIEPEMRVVFNGRIFTIRSVINLNERGESLRLLVEERVGEEEEA